MVVDFANSKTKLNLMKAFAGESQARERYSIAASFAGEKEIYIVQKVFLEIADQEKEHGEIFYEFLRQFSGQSIKFDADYPVDLFDSVLEYLKKSAKNETDEYEDIYDKFGKIAADEGFSDISNKFFGIAKIEKTHSEKFSKLAKLVESNELFKSNNGKAKWTCMKCGNVYEGTNVPEFCPVCGHARGYFVRNDICL